MALVLEHHCLKQGTADQALLFEGLVTLENVVFFEQVFLVITGVISVMVVVYTEHCILV